jgi:hypothetical protein
LKTLKRIVFVITLISGVICLLEYLLPWIIGKLFLNRTNSGNVIGIIGGADGPTAILVGKNSALCFIPLVIFVTAIVSWLILHFKTE